MDLRTLARQEKKLEQGVSGLALLQKKQVMEGRLWDMHTTMLLNCAQLQNIGTKAENKDRTANFSSF